MILSPEETEKLFREILQGERPDGAPDSQPAAPQPSAPKPRTPFDEIADEVRAESAEKLARLTHADKMRQAARAEHERRFPKPPEPAPAPNEPVVLDLRPEGAPPDRSRRFRRSYDWRKAAVMLAEGAHWQDAANAIGVTHKAMLRMRRNSPLFRRMIDEERRLKYEMAEGLVEQNLWRLPFLLEEQLKKKDGPTTRWLLRRGVGDRPNQIAAAFARSLPAKPK